MSDLSPLKDMKLTSLNCDGTHGVRPVAAEGHEADELWTAVARRCRDLSPLKDMKLTVPGLLR